MLTDILSIRPANHADAPMLAWLAATTFLSTYAGSVADEDLVRYVGRNFSSNRIGSELADPNIEVFVAESHRAMIGYALARDTTAPGFVPGDGPLELGRLYVASSARNMGVGSSLLARVQRHAADRGYDWLWLTVWEGNHAARAVYRAWGFDEYGTVRFPFGTEIHTDRVLAKRVDP